MGLSWRKNDHKKLSEIIQERLDGNVKTLSLIGEKINGFKDKRDRRIYKTKIQREAFFQEYDVPPIHESQPIGTKEKNLDPFKKVNWKNIFDENYKGNYRYRKVDGKLVWA